MNEKNLKILALGFILTVALGLSGSAVLAQETNEAVQDEQVSAQDLGVSNPKVLPGNPFYFLKNWSRGIQSFFAFSPEKKANLKLRFANEKLIEAKKLAEIKKNPKLVEKTLDGFQKEMEAVSKTDPEVLKKFSDKLTRQQILHQKLLEKLETQVPPDVYEKIKNQRERHLRRFAKVMEKIVPNDKIPDVLEKQLKNIKGSRFKEFKSLEFLDKMGENMPADIKARIEKRKEKMAKNFAQKLDEMPEAQKEKFKDYLEKTPGNKLRRLKAISQLQGEDVSEKLRDLMEKAKEKKIEALKNEKISPDKAQESIERAEKEITTAEKIVATTSTDEYGGRASRKLLELAKKHLDKAKSAFEEKKYGMAFGLSEASYREALNSERIAKRVNLIKKSPKKIKEKIEKLYPGIKLPEDVSKCKIPLMKKCALGEVMIVKRTKEGCPILRCVPLKKTGVKKPVSTSTAISSKFCPEVWQPVCGKDGKTYGNKCFANIAGVEIIHKGSCEVKELKTENKCREGERKEYKTGAGVPSTCLCHNGKWMCTTIMAK